MLADQALLVLSAAGTFLACWFLARIVTGSLSHLHPTLAELHSDFYIMDTSVVVTFCLGLLCALAVMYFLGLFGAPVSKNALNKDEWRAFKLIKRTPVSKSTNVLEFAIPGQLGLPIGQHVSVRAPVNGRIVMRSYTPISDVDEVGSVKLLVKSYPTGNLSRVLGELQVGESVEMKGPKGKFLYRRNMTERIGMLAGGTGITPCFQVLKAALKDKQDRTCFDLLYANVTEDEILLKDELDALMRENPLRFRVMYFLNKPPPAWNGGVGFITRDAIADFLPPATLDCRVLMCGPPPMMEAMKRHLVQLQFPEPRLLSEADDKVFVF
ncbi:cytochrome-b5 reductase [Malassezia caprae]|uniref:NADH-cytochrome b5 reductase n=1 Tax=Malassezia caprae TaxID=1381934 RepID=A0AAF0IXL7_9BASI|nr:cytochrome-b5 reductase [Malassezia caprae]